MAHLCPVRAYSRWVAATELKDGYVFRHLATGDRLGERGTFMVCTPPPLQYMQRQ